MQTHRQIAKRKTVLWQGAAVAVLLAAGAAIALPGVRKFLAPPPAPVKATLATTSANATSSGDAKPMPFSEADKALRSVSMWNKPPEVPVPVAVDTPPTAIVPAPPVATDWVYTGSFITSSSRSALIKIDNAQQMVPLNRVVNDTKVVTIEPDYIEIERSGAPSKRIELAARPNMNMPSDPSKKQVMFKGPPVFAAGAAGAMGTSGAPMGMAHPMSSQQGQTLEQFRMANLAAREAAARASGGQMPPVPGQPDPNQQRLDQGVRDEAVKYLMEPGQPSDVRSKYLQVIGITPGMPVETASILAQKAGLDPNTEAGRAILESLKNNANSAESKEGK